MTSAQPRPRIVDVAFWSWVASAIVLIIVGLWALTRSFATIRAGIPAQVPDDQVRTLVTMVRWTGGVYILIGIAIGFLAGRTRQGDKRFRRAAVTLSYATIVLVVLCALLLGFMPLPVTVALIGLIVAAVAVTRDNAAEWFDAVESGSDDA
jgi:hypothetical protein